MVSHLAFSKSVKMTQIVKSDIFKNYKIIIKSIIYKVNIKTTIQNDIEAFDWYCHWHSIPNSNKEGIFIILTSWWFVMTIILLSLLLVY